jgi:5-oxoprolinase (ATP-hydrolysing) subunit A
VAIGESASIPHSDDHARMIDLNADLGEGFGIWRLGDDDALLAVVSSANVACGFHAGDPLTMRRVCALAAANGVAIGAQVGYRDLAGFGRRHIDIAPDELAADVLYQIGALDACARSSSSRVRYVKPHGALYHAAATDVGQAGAIADAVAAFGGLPVLGLPDSALAKAVTDRGMPFVVEGFADRAYTPSGGLVSRPRAGAVIDDAARVVRRSVRLARNGEVEASDGTVVRVDARSLCLHGDTPNAAALARQVRAALLAAGMTIAPFA